MRPFLFTFYFLVLETRAPPKFVFLIMKNFKNFTGKNVQFGFNLNSYNKQGTLLQGQS